MSENKQVLNIDKFTEYVNENDGVVEVFTDNSPKHIEIMFHDETGDSDIETYCYHARFFNQNTSESVFLSDGSDGEYLLEFVSPKEVVDVLNDYVTKAVLCVFDIKDFVDVENLCAKTIN